MQELAGYEPCHGLQAHVGMRSDVERHARFDRDGVGMIDEAPGPHGAAWALGQDPADRQQAHLGEAQRDLHNRAVGLGRSPAHRRRVVGGDRSTHDVPLLHL
jgi:hypothetical protein